MTVAAARIRAPSGRRRSPATGQVKPAAGAELLVTAPQEARIAEMPKGMGDRVRRGELLVRFEIPTPEGGRRRPALGPGAGRGAAHPGAAERRPPLRALRARHRRPQGGRGRPARPRPGGGDGRRGPERARRRRPPRRARGGARALRRRRRRPHAQAGGPRRAGRTGAPPAPDRSFPAPGRGRGARRRLWALIAVGSPARVRGAELPRRSRPVSSPSRAAVDPATRRPPWSARLRQPPTRLPAGTGGRGGDRRARSTAPPSSSPPTALVQEGPESFVFIGRRAEEGPPPRGARSAWWPGG